MIIVGIPPSPISFTIVYLFPLIVIDGWMVYDAHRLPINDIMLFNPFCFVSYIQKVFLSMNQ